MSVIKNKRQESELDNINQFKYLFNYAIDRISYIPKRKRPYLSHKIADPINNLYSIISRIDDKYFQKGLSTINQENVNYDYLHRQIQSEINNLEKGLTVYFNIYNIEDKTQKYWENLINNFMQPLKRNDKSNTLTLSNLCKVNNKESKAKFIHVLKDLHKNIYALVIKAPTKYSHSIIKELTDLIDSAYYYALKANSIFPNNKEEFELRESYFSLSISALNSLERVLLTFFQLVPQKEKTLETISNLVSESNRLLVAVKRSDRKRFSNLD